MKKRIIGLSILGILILGGGGIWWSQTQNQSTSSSTSKSETSTETTERSTAQTSQTPSTTTTSTSQESTSSSSETPDRITEIMAEMTVAEKVGQLFLARYPRETALADLANNHLGGYLFFGQDFENESAERLLNKMQQLQNNQKVPLFIGADEEGGTVTRISRNPTLVASPFQSPQAIYQQSGWEGIRTDTINKAEILNHYGIQLGLFPVADVATDPNAFIYDRTIGLDAKGTSTFVETVVKALKGTGVASTLKHFPGYGNNLDSHVEIVRDTRTLKELENNDFIPFKAGIKAGVDSILVSHNIIESIDGTRPASISAKVIRVLREDLNFEGVIMTDDMDMLGLADFISQDQAALAALQAGNDLVLSSSYNLQVPVVIAAVESGDYSEADLDASVYRILSLKEKLGML